MQRPTHDVSFMRMAFVAAERATCPRKQVGAVIVRDSDRRVLASGYNGAPRGMPHCLQVGCEMKDFDGKPSCVRTLHAESNALDLLHGPITEPHTLYTTVIPCRDCALRIIQRGIQRVIYTEYYESRSTKDVVALFECTDTATAKLMTEKFGDPELMGWIAQPRVQLLKLDVPLWQLKPSYLPEHIPG